MIGSLSIAALLATVVVCEARASAECKPAGGVLVEVAQRGAPGAKRATATTRLYANGAWTREIFDRDHHVVRKRGGCLDTASVERVRAHVQAAPWKATPSGRTCRADQPRFTTYAWKGRVMYTDRTCNVDVLDAESRKTIDVLDVLLGVPIDLDYDDACQDNPLERGCH